MELPKEHQFDTSFPTMFDYQQSRRHQPASDEDEDVREEGPDVSAPRRAELMKELISLLTGKRVSCRCRWHHVFQLVLRALLVNTMRRWTAAVVIASFTASGRILNS